MGLQALRNRAPGSGSGVRAEFNWWKPTEPGEEIEGHIVRIWSGKFNNVIVELQLDDGTLRHISVGQITNIHRILFEDLRITERGWLAVIYDGLRRNAKTGREFKSWRADFKSVEAGGNSDGKLDDAEIAY